MLSFPPFAQVIKLVLGIFVLGLIPTASLDGQRVRSLYIDEIPRLMESADRRQAVLNQIRRYKVNELTLFKYFQHRESSQLQDFLKEARSRGVKHISAGFPVQYFQGSAQESEGLLEQLEVNSLTFENDFWVEERTQEAYEALNRLEKNRTRQQLDLHIYFGWFGEEVDANAMALRIAQTFDRILLHHYREGADFPYLHERLRIFGKAAMRYGRKQKVVLRIHTGSPYFETMSPSKLQRVYQKLEEEFQSSKEGDRALRYIELVGWQAYNSRFL